MSKNILKYIFEKEKENNTPPEVGEQSEQYKKEERWKKLRCSDGRHEIIILEHT